MSTNTNPSTDWESVTDNKDKSEGGRKLHGNGSYSLLDLYMRIQARN